jgi:DNA-binding PadR family transcriptional regulator
MNPLANLLRQGLVETVLENGEVCYQLTEKGRSVYEEIENEIKGK